ncbi:Uncharacterised protein [Sebaldella termitidis]|jgi:hypothetical protein|uniref:Uncharacterized protein n=1 Tax=Sebaldella termitidis (strain ATCC 33386 / NCTC 11300) TaxID=526218 RepID=D1AN07_SEBTE|nr:FxLYD domain-containing protein [Sebaldella termitidis]ACZ07383.1 hypothetical protein Sterm_0508 [Sebaldella termitidis ATCC 33386]SUI22678.1 Uncharacterised protein [Sebaldella termitidis]
MKKIMLLITLSGMLAVVSFSFNVGGFIKDKVSEKVDETISNQMYTMSKPVIKYSKDKKEVFITGTIKNLGPKVNNVYVFVPCYDSKGGTIPDADAHIGTIGAGETWNFSAEAMATNGLTIGSCDLKRIKVRGF